MSDELTPGAVYYDAQNDQWYVHLLWKLQRANTTDDDRSMMQHLATLNGERIKIDRWTTFWRDNNGTGDLHIEVEYSLEAAGRVVKLDYEGLHATLISMKASSPDKAKEAARRQLAKQTRLENQGEV